MIRVYEASENLLIHTKNNIKYLTPLYAEVTKVDNGDYYLEVEDVLDNLEYYQKGMVLIVKTPWNKEPGFRCDNPRIQNNRMSCKAWHLSYDAKNYIINEAYAVEKNCNDALNHYSDSTDRTSYFPVFSDIATIATTEAKKKSLFDVALDLVNVYSGHLSRDERGIDPILYIRANIGQDRGVV